MLLVLLLAAAAAAFAQTPTPAQGRDAGPPIVMRVVKVDSQGRLIISPSSAGFDCTLATPCVVAGVDAGGIARELKTDASGQLSPANAAVASADAIASNARTLTDSAGNPVYPRVEPLLWNGAAFDRDINCPNQAAITGSSVTGLKIASLVALQNIYVCHLDFTLSSAVDVTIQQGTGPTCGTTTVSLSGTYPGASGIVGYMFDYSNASPLKTTVAARDLCLTFSAAVSVGGVIKYAQF